jgi:hypothetical protein
VWRAPVRCSINIAAAWRRSARSVTALGSSSRSIFACWSIGSRWGAVALRAVGLAPEKLIHILADTAGAAAAIKQRGPEIVRGVGGADTGPGSFDIGKPSFPLESTVNI